MCYYTNMELTHTTLKELIFYDPETGFFTWKERPEFYFKTYRAFIQWNKRYANGPAFFTVAANDYLTGFIFKKKYYAHRLAWLYMTGEWPEGDIDHINGQRNDNRWENLREVNRSENLKNAKRRYDNKTGVTGVFKHKNKESYYSAYIDINYKRKYLLHTKDFDAAVAARKEAEIKYKFHENHGRK